MTCEDCDQRAEKLFQCVRCRLEVCEACDRSVHLPARRLERDSPEFDHDTQACGCVEDRR
jgi:hypothetical protein